MRLWLQSNFCAQSAMSGTWSWPSSQLNDSKSLLDTINTCTFDEHRKNQLTSLRNTLKSANISDGKLDNWQSDTSMTGVGACLAYKYYEVLSVVTQVCRVADMSR